MLTYKAVQLSYPCPECGAGPGEKCRTKTGNPKSECHAVRWDGANRCRKCHERIPADYDPGELCDRCKLVRRLEIERATYHRRNSY